MVCVVGGQIRQALVGPLDDWAHVVALAPDCLVDDETVNEGIVGDTRSQVQYAHIQHHPLPLNIPLFFVVTGSGMDGGAPWQPCMCK